MTTKPDLPGYTSPFKGSSDRILELELEVKRLRDAHQQVLDSEAKDGDYLRLCILHQNISQDALSAPPPALAEAYVRLRGAVSIMVGGINPYTVQDVDRALAEIERLEGGGRMSKLSDGRVAQFRKLIEHGNSSELERDLLAQVDALQSELKEIRDLLWRAQIMVSML